MIRANSRWINIYTGDKVTVTRVFHGIVQYQKDIPNVLIDTLRIMREFQKPEETFLNSYKPI